MRTLADLADDDGLFGDGDWVETKDQDPAGDVRLIQLSDVGDGVFRDRSDRFLTKETAEELGCTYLRAGDILIARMPEPLGRACVFPGVEQPAVTAVDVCILRPAGSIDARWIMHAINAPQFRRSVYSLQSGTTRKRISRKNLGAIQLPIPTLKAQIRIREEIDKQFTRLDFASNALQRCGVNLRRWRSSILHDSLSGAKWPSLPLREVCSVHIGATPSRTVDSYWQGDIAWVVSKDLHKKFIAETNERITQAGLDNTSTEVHPVGTILLGMIGQGPTRGLAAILKVPACTSQNLAALRPREDTEVLPMWLLYWLDSQYGYLRSLGSGNNQKALNKKVVESILVPLPPMEEQRGVVERLETRLPAAEAIAQAVAVSAQRQMTLRQKVLSDAFRGTLVRGSSSEIGDA